MLGLLIHFPALRIRSGNGSVPNGMEETKRSRER